MLYRLEGIVIHCIRIKVRDFIRNTFCLVSIFIQMISTPNSTAFSACIVLSKVHLASLSCTSSHSDADETGQSDSWLVPILLSCYQAYLPSP